MTSNETQDEWFSRIAEILMCEDRPSAIAVACQSLQDTNDQQRAEMANLRKKLARFYSTEGNHG